MRSWQSRLAAKDGLISQKLIGNTIANVGLATDCIFIRAVPNKVQDLDSIMVDDIGTINISFDEHMKDIPLRKFLGNEGYYVQSGDVVSDKEADPLVGYVESKYNITQGSIILKFFKNPQTVTINTESSPIEVKPLVLALKCSEILGTFGAYHLIYQKILFTYHDDPIPQKIYDWCVQLATRRNLLGW